MLLFFRRKLPRPTVLPPFSSLSSSTMAKTGTNETTGKKKAAAKKPADAKHSAPGDNAANIPVESPPNVGVPGAAGMPVGRGSSGKKNKPWLTKKSSAAHDSAKNKKFSKNTRAVATYYFVEIIGMTLILLRKWSEKKACDSVFRKLPKDSPHAEFMDDTGLAHNIIVNPVDEDGQKIENEDGFPHRLCIYLLRGEDNDLSTTEACAQYHSDDMCPALHMHHLIEERSLPKFGNMETVPSLGELVSVTDVVKVIRTFFDSTPREFCKVPGNIYRFYRRGKLPHAAITMLGLPQDVIDPADKARFAMGGAIPDRARASTASGSANLDHAAQVSQDDV